jgi:AcrR family transcriptional regulator
VAVMTDRSEDGAGSGTVAGSAAVAPAEGRRREEVLDTAAQLFASSGLRTSVQDIADACGIKPGSLYHHFESKEAIVVQLLKRYHAELDRTAEAGLRQLRDLDRPPLEQVTRLGTAIARCAVRHSAAVQFTFYEPPASAGNELADLASRAPGAIEAAMLATLRAGQDSGSIRANVDLEVLADRICQTMLHVSLGLFHRYTAVHRVAGLLCGMMLHGLSAAPVEDTELDQSAAMLAVEQVIRHWDDSDQEPADGRVSLVRRAARAEFGRRGYEVTTVRDIASVAGLSTGTTYRLVGSKEALLDAIMSAFYEKVMAGWDAALGSASTAVEKLDALAWLQINVLDKFKDEYKIQLAWMRELPPDADLPAWSFSVAIRQLKTLLGQGSRQGQLRVDSPSSELTARCVIELTWMPEGIVRAQGNRAALIYARDTVLRGIAVR